MRTLSVIVGVLVSAQLAASSPPQPVQIEAAMRAITDCRLADPAALLEAEWLAGISALQSAALYADAAYDADQLFGRERWVVSELRQSRRYDAADVYAADCRAQWTEEARAALRQMRPADPVVVRNAAYVPLLTARGDYLGTGLAFLNAGDGWRFVGWESTALAARTGDRLLVDAMQTTFDWYSDESVEQCPAPPAPMQRFNFQPEELEYEDTDEANALGAAQRLAAREYALGLRGPASDTAKLILAEVYLRSLRFDSAPAPGTPAWARRIERAENLIGQVERSDLDWSRMAPALVWLSRVRQFGDGALVADPGAAKRHHALAQRAGITDTPMEDLKSSEALSGYERAAPPLSRASKLETHQVRPVCPSI